MKHYISSVVSKYGDIERVKDDVKSLRNILSRQGDALLIDVIAEMSGETANKFNLNTTERQALIQSLVESLNSALSERL